MTARAVMTKRRRMLIDILRKNGGAASTYRMEQLTWGHKVADPALWRAAAVGIVKKVDIGEADQVARLSSTERERLQAAIEKQPRAYAFWVLADAYAGNEQRR